MVFKMFSNASQHVLYASQNVLKQYSFSQPLLWKGAKRDLSKCSQNVFKMSTSERYQKRYIWEYFENQYLRTHASLKKYHLRTEWEPLFCWGEKQIEVLI